MSDTFICFEVTERQRRLYSGRQSKPNFELSNPM